jgi:hypothetical protein
VRGGRDLSSLPPFSRCFGRGHPSKPIVPFGPLPCPNLQNHTNCSIRIKAPNPEKALIRKRHLIRKHHLIRRRYRVRKVEVGTRRRRWELVSRKHLLIRIERSSGVNSKFHQGALAGIPLLPWRFPSSDFTTTWKLDSTRTRV